MKWFRATALLLVLVVPVQSIAIPIGNVDQKLAELLKKKERLQRTINGLTGVLQKLQDGGFPNIQGEDRVQALIKIPQRIQLLQQMLAEVETLIPLLTTYGILYAPPPLFIPPLPSGPPGPPLP